MKLSLSVTLVAIIATITKADPADPPEGTEILETLDGENGYCYDDQGFFDWGNTAVGAILSAAACDSLCQSAGDTSGLLGFSWSARFGHCVCKYDDGMLPVPGPPDCGVFDNCNHAGTGQGPLEYVSTDLQIYHDTYICYRYLSNTEGTGDPHCKYNYNIIVYCRIWRYGESDES